MKSDIIRRACLAYKEGCTGASAPCSGISALLGDTPLIPAETLSAGVQQAIKLAKEQA